MSSNNKNKNNSSRGHGPMKINEKPEDFALSIKRLLWSLRDFKVLIFVALILAALSSVLSLVAPNKLSDLTDEISRGITINTTNMKELEDDLTSNVSEIGSILDINIDENTIYMVNTSNISDFFDKRIFMIVMISRLKETTTKNNDVMAFIVGSDEFGEVDLTCFPDVYKKFNNIKVGNIIKIFGKVEKRYDKYQVIINNISILE